MNDCPVCGWCETPGRCVWAVECPRCGAAPGRQCVVPGTGKLEGLHAERHAAAAATEGGRDTGISRADWEELKRVEEEVLA